MQFSTDGCELKSRSRTEAQNASVAWSAVGLEPNCYGRAAFCMDGKPRGSGESQASARTSSDASACRSRPSSRAAACSAPSGTGASAGPARARSPAAAGSAPGVRRSKSWKVSAAAGRARLRPQRAPPVSRPPAQAEDLAGPGGDASARRGGRGRPPAPAPRRRTSPRPWRRLRGRPAPAPLLPAGRDEDAQFRR